MVERILNRWPWKLLAIVAAYAIWLSVISEGNIVRDLTLPLEVEPGPTQVLLSPPVNEIDVRVRGLETTIERISESGLTAELVLRPGDPGERTYGVDDIQIRGLPRAVEVVRIEPSSLTLSVDRNMRKFLRVQPNFEGQPESGFRRYGWRAIPEKLEIEGPASVLQGIEEIATEPILLTGRTSAFTASVKPVFTGEPMRLIDQRSLVIDVEIDQDPIEKRFVNLPIIHVGTIHQATISPRTTSVTISGPPQIIAEMDPQQIRVIADLSYVEPGPETHTIPLSIRLENIQQRPRELLTATPAITTVKVRLTENESEQP